MIPLLPVNEHRAILQNKAHRRVEADVGVCSLTSRSGHAFQDETVTCAAA